ncbi:hypothetical protein E2C01_086999 [Portunus trituberculatus]|uniref:Uncharacterized protein n=1 Tax=Portunus trituberculatus TaxID=210409 RepID=A0A5B7JB77_PORTR|nr:hypothetical protein [Portunus trituberculatus]
MTGLGTGRGGDGPVRRVSREGSRGGAAPDGGEIRQGESGCVSGETDTIRGKRSVATASCVGDETGGKKCMLG